MNYKISTFVLLIALIAFSVYHFTMIGQEFSFDKNEKERIKIKAIRSNLNYFNKDLNEKFKNDQNELFNPPPHDRLSRLTRGGRIPLSLAKDQVRRYRDYMNDPTAISEPVTNTSAYYFGKNSFKEYLDLLMEDSLVVGLRAYRVINYGNITGNNMEPFFDLVFVAVDEKGNNYPNIGALSEEVNTSIGFPPPYNQSSPCPEDCGEGGTK